MQKFGPLLTACAALRHAPHPAALAPCSAKSKSKCRHRRRVFGYAATAKLLLSGHWLEAAGFVPGTVAQVEVQAGRLIITPAAVQ